MEVDKSIAQILDAYAGSVHEKHVDSFMRLYDPQVRVFDTWGVWSYEGAESWQRAVEAWFTSLGNERVKVSFEDVKAVVTREFASVSAIVTYTGVSAQGVELRALQNRLSWVLKTRGHVLRIVHEHTSAPVGFDDMKALLRRPGTGQPAP